MSPGIALALVPVSPPPGVSPESLGVGADGRVAVNVPEGVGDGSSSQSPVIVLLSAEIVPLKTAV